MADKTIHSIILIGLKHSGKSTMGKLLAQKLDTTFYDTDDVIQEISGLSPRQLFAKKGPAAFMTVEEEACRKVISKIGDKPVVIATGGGICDNAPALNELQSVGSFLFLKLNMEYSIKRIEDKIEKDEFGEFKNMPSYVAVHNPKNMMQIHQILTDKFTERFSLYESIADKTVLLKNAPIEVNFKAITEALNL